MQMTAMLHGGGGFRALRPRVVLALAAVVGFSTSCAMLKNVAGFKEQVKMAKATGLVNGTIDVERGATGTLVVVIAIPSEGADGRPLALDSYVRRRAGTYAFAVEPGRYVVGAYEDRNENQLLDPGELVKRLRLGREFVVASGEVVTEDLLLTETDGASELAESIDIFAIVSRTPNEQRRFSLSQLSVKGEICHDLNDDGFNHTAAARVAALTW